MSDQDKYITLKPTPYIKEDKCPDDRKKMEDEKQMLQNGSAKTKTHTEEEKSNPESSSYKYPAGTEEIKQCALKPLTKISENTISPCNENIIEIKLDGKKKVCTSPKTSKITATSVNQSENIKETMKNANKKSYIRINEKNASQRAEVKHLSGPEQATESHICSPKHLMTVQIPKACCSKPQINLPSTLQSKQLVNVRSQTHCSVFQAQENPPTEKSQMRVSKPVITTTSELVCPTQITTVNRYDAGSQGLTTATPVPVRSGLRLLSIISTESSPKVQITSTDISKATAKTKDGFSISPDNTSKTTRIANSTITLQSPTPKAGTHLKSPITTSKTQPAVAGSLSSTTTSQIPTVKCAIGATPPFTTPQKSISMSTTTAQTPTMKEKDGNLRSHITTDLISLSQTTPPLKENESPITPQSAPAFKAWIPPSDIDPMSQTFLRMPFTYQSLQVQCSHGNRPHVKRPMNAFMVWAKKNRSSIAKRYDENKIMKKIVLLLYLSMKNVD